MLQVVIPAGVAPGVRALSVTNRDGGSATLPQAYTAFAAESDDLSGNSYELWTNPSAPHANTAAQVGLVVHREAGKQVLNGVIVRFYIGNPNQGGNKLGDGAISLLSPRSSASTSGVDLDAAGRDICALRRHRSGQCYSGNHRDQQCDQPHGYCITSRARCNPAAC